MCAEAIAGGADAIQLRDKRATSLELYRVAVRMRELTRSAGVLFIVNDRVDIAMAVGADGVHLGTHDLPVVAARRLLGPGKVIGFSPDSVAELEQAQAWGTDYIGYGPIFQASAAKGDAGAPIGPEAVREAKKHTRLPIVGIGGITARNAAHVIAAGAAGVAVVSAVVAAPDVAKAVRELKRVVEAARGKA